MCKCGVEACQEEPEEVSGVLTEGSFGEMFVKCGRLFQEEECGDCDDNASSSEGQAKKKISAIAGE